MQHKAVYLLFCKFSLQLRREVAAQNNDQYRRLQLQFSVPLMMGVVDTLNT